MSTTSPDLPADGAQSAERVIVFFRLAAESVPKEYLVELRAMVHRADALGAQLVHWGVTSVAFAFEADSLEEAIGLVDETLSESVQVPFAATFSFGLLERAFAEHHRSELAWGPALLVAASLAQHASPRQVLVHGATLGDQLNTVPFVRDARFETRFGRVGELQLDDPMRRIQTKPGLPPVRYPSPSAFDDEEANPEALAARLSQLSRDALFAGDPNALEKWSEGLRATGENDQLAARMLAMARLSRGRVTDALRTLEAARGVSEGHSAKAQCQSALAYAVGLAFAARPQEALLEGVGALSRAREAADAKAIRACMAFLAKLYRNVGRPTEADQIDHAASLVVA